MAVTIVPTASTCRVKVMGDIETIMHIPAEPPQTCADGWKWIECYYIALSDGTLIKATNHINPEFEVVREGAGIVKVQGSKLIVDWDVEWIALSSIANATAWKHNATVELPLFPEAQPAMAA